MGKNNMLSIYTDGGARGNPGKAAIGVVIKDQSGQTIFSQGKTIGETTNNVAEYKALIFALSKVSALLTSHDKITIYMDSNLIVNQMKGLFKIKKPHLKSLYDEAMISQQKLAVLVEYHHIPREKNQEADFLVNTALDQDL